jgi:hypothetical protein
MNTKQNNIEESIPRFIFLVIAYFIFNIILFTLFYYIFKNINPNLNSNFYNKIMNYSIPGLALSGIVSTILIAEPTLRFNLSEINQSKFIKLIIPIFIFPFFYYLDYYLKLDVYIFSSLWLIGNYFYSNYILNNEENLDNIVGANKFLTNKYVFIYSFLSVILNTSILNIIFKEKLDGFNIIWILILLIITFIHSQFLFYIKNKFRNSSIYIIIFLILAMIIPFFIRLYK